MDFLVILLYFSNSSVNVKLLSNKKSKNKNKTSGADNVPLGGYAPHPLYLWSHSWLSRHPSPISSIKTPLLVFSFCVYTACLSRKTVTFLGSQLRFFTLGQGPQALLTPVHLPRLLVTLTLLPRELPQPPGRVRCLLGPPTACSQSVVTRSV